MSGLAAGTALALGLGSGWDSSSCSGWADGRAVSDLWTTGMSMWMRRETGGRRRRVGTEKQQKETHYGMRWHTTRFSPPGLVPYCSKSICCTFHHEDQWVDFCGKGLKFVKTMGGRMGGLWFRLCMFMSMFVYGFGLLFITQTISEFQQGQG